MFSFNLSSFKKSSFFNSADRFMELLIKDPIHSYVGIDRDAEPVLISVLGTYEVQRLRRIRQLGLAHFSYPGAEHSRFGHSLGMMHVGRKILDQFYLNRELDASSYVREKILFSLAAILHDVGHGPYSHTYESITGISHTELTLRLIRGQSEVNAALSEVARDLPEQIARIIEGRHEKRYLCRLVDSQLDADRLDYVLRDATMCGVKYGIFDLDRIVHTLRLRDGRVFVSEKGLGAVEEYLLARYFMYWHVYFHKTTLSISNVFLNGLRRARDLFRQGKELFLLPAMERFFMSQKENEVDLVAFTSLDDPEIQVHMKQWMKGTDGILSDLAARFINRRPFKARVYHDRSDADEAEEEFRAVLGRMNYDPEYFLIRDIPSKSLYNYYTPGTGDREDQNIYFENAAGSLEEISSSPDSTIRHLLKPVPERIYLFVPREVFEQP